MSHAVEDSGTRQYGFTACVERLREQDEATSRWLAERLGLKSARGDTPKPIDKGGHPRFSNRPKPKPQVSHAGKPCVVCGKPIPEGRYTDKCSIRCSKAACRERAKAKGHAWASPLKNPVPLGDLTNTGLRLRMANLQHRLSKSPDDRVLKTHLGMAQAEFQRRQG